MQNDFEYKDRRFPPYEKRPRTPRFGLFILIIMAIISVVIAITVAYFMV